MALLLLLSTVSWTVEKHFCMGRLMDVSFFMDAEDCGMEAAVMLMGDEEGNHCCDDESFTLEGQDDLKLNWNDIDLDRQYFLTVFTNSYLSLFSKPLKPSFEGFDYPPPILVRDIQLLDQVFLI